MLYIHNILIFNKAGAIRVSSFFIRFSILDYQRWVLPGSLGTFKGRCQVLNPCRLITRSLAICAFLSLSLSIPVSIARHVRRGCLPRARRWRTCPFCPRDPIGRSHWLGNDSYSPARIAQSANKIGSLASARAFRRRRVFVWVGRTMRWRNAWTSHHHPRINARKKRVQEKREPFYSRPPSRMGLQRWVLAFACHASIHGTCPGLTPPPPPSWWAGCLIEVHSSHADDAPALTGVVPRFPVVRTHPKAATHAVVT